ncbi:hypothetical protein ACLE5L_27220 [Klebsiella pneumoniae]
MREMSDSHDGLFLNAQELEPKGYLAQLYQFTAVDLHVEIRQEPN